MVAARNKKPNLDKLIRELCVQRADQRDRSEALAELRSALEAGSDPDAKSLEGETPLEALVSQIQLFMIGGDPIHTEVADLLIRHGANPLTQGKAFYNGLNKLLKTSLSIVVGMVATFDDLERAGAGVRDEQEGNYLHHAFEAGSWRIGAAFADGRLLGAQNPMQFSPRILNHQREDGATPLHVLWDHCVTETSAFHNEIAGEAWRVTEKLMRQGADISLKRHDGVRVDELIEQALTKGFSVGAEQEALRDRILGALKADREMTPLMANTPSASGKSAGGPRRL